MLHPWAGAAPDITTLRPDGAGDSTEASITGNTPAATNWESVDEATSDGDNTTVTNTGGGSEIDLYSMANSATPLGKINSVTVNTLVMRTAAGGTVETKLITYATEYTGTGQAPTVDWVTYSTAYNLNPNTSANWTWLEVNNLQAGQRLSKAKATQVWVDVDHSPSSLESFKEGAHTTAWGDGGNPYNESNQTVYIHGGNFTWNHAYHVGYYDGNGTRIQSYTPTMSGNDLSSEYILTTDLGAAAGTWHAAVFDDDLGTPPNTYADVAGAAGFVVEDSFEVAQSAIPEFPTVISAMVAAGMCFIIYYWMRKKVSRVWVTLW